MRPESSRPRDRLPQWKPQTLLACWNAGELTSIVLGTSRPTSGDQQHEDPSDNARVTPARTLNPDPGWAKVWLNLPAN